jgi:hypothetical protein
MLKIAQHYAKLAMNQGWIDYTRHRVRELEKNPQWKGLGKCVAEQIKLLKKQQSTGK